MASENSDPNTKVSNRADIFNDDQDDQPADMDASKRMEAMMNMVLVEEDTQAEQTNEDDQEESMEEDEEEDAFAFRLFSTDTVAKVSIKENHEEAANALSQQIANQQQIDHDETDPAFLANITQASISYDDIMQQSTWAYPALRLPKRVTHFPSSSSLSKIPNEDNSTSTTTSSSSTTATDKPKRKSKKRRDYEKAVKEGRITPKPNMRDPRTPGGWPGYPGARDPCAIINAQPYRGFKGKQQKSGPPSGFGSGRGRGGGFGGRGRGRGGGFGGPGGPARFKKAVAV